jgi:hypothetical protein
VSTVVWQPSGAEASGAMPSSTAWARVVAAKKSGAKMVEVRIVKVQGSLTTYKTHKYEAVCRIVITRDGAIVPMDCSV